MVYIVEIYLYKLWFNMNSFWQCLYLCLFSYFESHPNKQFNIFEYVIVCPFQEQWSPAIIISC